jgi:hypothetical protein
MNWHNLPKSGMQFSKDQDKEPARILPFLYLGGKAHAKDKGTLNRLNIKHILNMTPSREMGEVIFYAALL